MDHNFERAFTRQRPCETAEHRRDALFRHFRHVLRIRIVGASQIHHQAFYGRRLAKVRNSGENYQGLKDVLCAYTADR
jgi:hypothetical protein